MMSVLLFRRLWSNHRGYAVLFKSSLMLESDIILRSGVETAICITANFRLRDEFVSLMRRDAVYTLQGQIKLHREAGDAEMVSDAESSLKETQAVLPPGVKGAKLDWKALAEAGGVPLLYNFHRMLSGASSHVTGLSILHGAESEDGSVSGRELARITKRMHFTIMLSATLQGAMIHAGMIGADQDVLAANALLQRLNTAAIWNEVGV